MCEFGRMDPAFELVQMSRSIRDIVKAFDMEDEYDSALLARKDKQVDVSGEHEDVGKSIHVFDENFHQAKPKEILEVHYVV